MVDLASLLQDRLGVETFDIVNRLVTTIGTTAVRVIPNDPNRVAFVLVNLSTGTMHFGPFSDPSGTKGIQIGSGGGSLVSIWDEDFSLVGREWYGVSSVAASELLTLELVTKPERRGGV